MNVRRILSFFRTPLGRLCIFLLLFFIFISGGMFRKKSKKIPQVMEKEGATYATHSRFIREIPPLLKKATPRPISLMEPPESVPKPLIDQELATYEPIITPVLLPPPPIPMAIYDSDLTTSSSPIKQYLPFGRLIRCELINTVDTSNMLTPLIGLVTHDIWHEGTLMIPAGTEVHGSAAHQPERERVGTGTQWMFVFHDGRELGVSGIALDHAPIPDKEMWEISDGSAGLRGNMIQNDRYTEIKAVAAAMVAAAADGFTDTTNYVNQFGGGTIRKVPGWRTAVTSGLERGAQLISQRLLEREDPFFVRVPAGTTFYLYVTQSIDLQEASIAGSESNSTSPKPSADSTIQLEKLHPES